MNRIDVAPILYRRRRRLVLRFVLLLALGAGLWLTLQYLNVRLERFATLFDRLGILLTERYYPPDFEYILRPRFLQSVLETIHMALVATLVGLLLAVPLAWFAAFNASPLPRAGQAAARVVITGARAIHEMIWAIVFIMVLGYGVLAGVLALTLGCIGFAGKLFAEEIESIDDAPVEAMRASGAGSQAVFFFGVLPQVRTAFIGISIYTWDVVFRSATVVGFFGAGGMGWYLRRTADQLQSDRVAAIILLIAALVVISELVSHHARTALEGRSGQRVLER
ncbi:phosphonate ABC transporter, permease protein PhnE [Desulfobulbus alkaliphilus]|uniref:phosphonate ABC transporter, permease protein PhnE n=1 Tax=Desulfobulbus alkaliphilus TaxID=869814 RepID=UPI0019649EC3|nr:phosphonate ABC transporter, permease protein PhnE [Desulfobulbus alkaliphilus]MBM9536105.1 phosphonate ABC transporter, permease protein PhnE [Desulfobulbus alkaliphilus]